MVDGEAVLVALREKVSLIFERGQNKSVIQFCESYCPPHLHFPPCKLGLTMT